MEKLEYKKAFKVILKKAVDADPSKEITLIYDELFFKYFQALSEIINELHFKITYIYIPYSYQNMLQNNDSFSYNNEIHLPAGINAAINKSNIVLNFLTGNTKSSKVRGAVLNYIKDNGCKVVHCPNISDEILRIVRESSFEKVYSDCELMAWSLGNSEIARIHTMGPDGEKYELNIKLGGWSNDPFISAGIVFENSWGNIPPGETFCCPKVSNVTGSICINGSIPGYLFKDHEYLILNFIKGKLIKWEATLNSEIINYINKIIEEAKLHNDNNWDTFAEFGIGLNPAIRSLTGNSIFDEKMAGTIHIAIGDNVAFGHPVQSHIHEDLVTKKPSLYLDEKLVIDNGKIMYKTLNSLRNNFTPPPIEDLDQHRISFKSAKIYLNNGKITRKLNKGQRVGHINIFNNSHSPILRKLYELLIKEDMDDIRYAELIKKIKPRNKEENLKQIVETLIHYKMITIKSKL